MHPVADKIKMTSFEGTVEVLGKSRRLGFVGAVEHDGKEVEPSALIVNGLTMEEAWEVISRLHGPVMVAESRDVTPAIEQQRVQPKTTAASEKSQDIKKAVEKAPAPEPEQDDRPEEGTKGHPEDEPAWMQGLDIGMLVQQDKLRPVIEHMIEKGLKTPDAIVKACLQLKGQVPALKAVDAKGGFEKRIERSASIVISGDKAS